MLSISIDIAPKSFAICILEGIFNSTTWDNVHPEEISMSGNCRATVYLNLREAKKLADKFGRLIPKLNTGYAQYFRENKSDLLRQIQLIEKAEAPIEKRTNKVETTPPAWLLEIDPDL